MCDTHQVDTQMKVLEGWNNDKYAQLFMYIIGDDSNKQHYFSEVQFLKTMTFMM